MKRSLDYEYRATQQRLLGIERQLDERWAFRLVVDRYDAEADLRRIERAMKRQTITATIAYDKEHHLSVA